MRTLSKMLVTVFLAAAPAALLACGDDASDDSPGGTAGSGGSGGSGGGSGATGGAGGAGGTGATGGTGGTGATGGTGGGTGGSGGGTAPQCDLDESRPVELLQGDITADKTLTSDKQWELRGVVRVVDGVTLTIDKCTKITGDKDSLGTLVVLQGGKVMAEGTADEPILFTSKLPPGSRAAGDWGGLIVLGRAPNNKPDFPSIEGLTTDEKYGGTDADDSSGVLSYVRIEYSGVEIGDGNEINGLTLGSVGRGTRIDHVMVSNTLDDCFEFFGGTVDASHLVCNSAGDDMFDMDQGYVGRLQFLFGRQGSAASDDPNGFECDNDKTDPAVAPVSDPTVYNATVVGQNADVPNQQYGAVFRRGFLGQFHNIVVVGFEAGVDLRDVPPTDTALMHSVFFGNTTENVAYAEDDSNSDTKKNDDGGFDEVAWFGTAGWGNSEADPGLTAPFAAQPDPRPATPTPGATPPDDGFFDPTGTYVGAFQPGDTWMSGTWIDWSPN